MSIPSTLLTCRLIALDKHPGVQQIGIGDTARRIISKAWTPKEQWVVYNSVVGKSLGMRLRLQYMLQGLPLSPRKVRLHYLMLQTHLMPAQLSGGIADTSVRAFLPSSSTHIAVQSISLWTVTVILSQEGTTQGDPLAMPMYELATIPLISDWMACADRFGMQMICCHWYNALLVAELGPAFGYFPNPTKTWIVVKQEHHQEASRVFA